MTREKTLGILAVGFVLHSVAANAESRLDTGAARQAAAHDAHVQGPAESATWHVEGSLRSTLKTWAREKGWPTPRFLTNADWPVDVPGTITGSIEEALKTLADGFSQSPSRPRIEVAGNHVIVVTEVDAE